MTQTLKIKVESHLINPGNAERNRPILTSLLWSYQRHEIFTCCKTTFLQDEICDTTHVENWDEKKDDVIEREWECKMASNATDAWIKQLFHRLSLWMCGVTHRNTVHSFTPTSELRDSFNSNHGKLITLAIWSEGLETSPKTSNI